MKKSMKAFTQKTTSIANGNYFEEINPQEYRTNLNSIAISFDQLQKQILSHIFEMQVVSSQIDSSTKEISGVLSKQKELSEQIFKNSENLTNANERSYANVSESVSISKEMAQNTEALQKYAQTLQASSSHSKEIISSQLDSIVKIIALIENISTTSHESMAYINKLFNSTTKISEILKTVQAFYKQTQLLSLNASIESARAGEAGAGFSVVANQIRTLAQNSSHSVDQISTIIEEIDYDIHNVIEQSKLTQTSVTTAVENTNIIQDGLKKIDETYSEVDEHIQGMRKKIDSNLTLFDTLNTTISESSTSSGQVAAEIESIHTHIHTLYEKTNDISKLEVNLKDTSKSLHALTDKVELDLLSDAKEKIKRQVSDLIENLTVLIKENPNLRDINTYSHKKILDIVLNGSNQMEAIWTNDAKGNFIYSNPPAGIANATVRDWFNESMKGIPYVSTIYISAISKSPCMTISIPIHDKSKQIVGVIGADIGIHYQ
ncbi:MAG: hypothetical protein CVU84_07580 [Firmicutes bacterium HGW-Firmicutes-1]|jgi:methyl-accepting chemotaxis protein|nr:MAG: hypothetical protein CVU84_07580 [Firmicutes bacterium HGW-Firmicutes-1]